MFLHYRNEPDFPVIFCFILIKIKICMAGEQDNVNNPADRNENGEGKTCGYMPKCFFRWPQAV